MERIAGRAILVPTYRTAKMIGSLNSIYTYSNIYGIAREALLHASTSPRVETSSGNNSP